MAVAEKELVDRVVGEDETTSESAPELSIVDGGESAEQAEGPRRKYVTFTEPEGYANARFGEDFGEVLIIRVHQGAGETFTMPNLIGALQKHVEKLGLVSDVEVTRGRDKAALGTFFYVDTETSQAARKASGVRERGAKVPRTDLGLKEISRVLARMHKLSLDETFIADAKATGAKTDAEIRTAARTAACKELNYSEEALQQAYAALNG